ncbi:MAG TPA: N-6 DNA methylase [Chitinophagaceae bacterium]|nr:N-6 DNA methylase [Chitinophagaceae bacterium]
MLPNNVQLEIEKRWEATQPLNIVRPLIIIDLVTYLLFVKRLDELQAFQEKKAEEAGTTLENPVFKKEHSELRWSYFKTLDRERLHQLFVKDGGIIEFISEYGKEPHVFSNFLKTPLILKPTPILLENAVSIVKCIDAADDAIKGEVYEFLLHKAVLTSKSRQLPLPDHLVKTLVTMMEPAPDDVIYDPSAGISNVLIACAEYLKEKNSVTALGDVTSGSFLSETLFGTDQDPALLRMGAMNMILHGIEDPQLKVLASISETENIPVDDATLIIANPPLINRVQGGETEETPSHMGDNRQTGLMYLALLLKSLKKGGRAAVLVPESVVLGTSPAHKQMREHLIDNHKLEGIISMPGGIFRPYSGIGTNILLIKKDAPSSNDQVWFYEMENDGFSLDDKRTPLHSAQAKDMMFPQSFGDIPEILNLWKNRMDEGKRVNTNKSFYVPVQQIREKHYDLKNRTYKVNSLKPKVEKPEVYATSIDVVPIDVTERRSALEELREKKNNKNYTADSSNSKSSKVFFLTVLLLGIVSIASYFIYTNNKGVATNVLAMESNNLPEPQKETATKETKVEDEKPIASTDNSRSINVLESKVNDENEAQGALLQNDGNMAAADEITTTPIQVVNTPKRVKAVRYNVVSNAAFYDAPAKNSRRKTPVLYANNSFGPLKPLEEKNGFVYVVVTDKESETYKGWLNKNDLKKVTISTFDADAK